MQEYLDDIQKLLYNPHNNYNYFARKYAKDMQFMGLGFFCAEEQDDLLKVLCIKMVKLNINQKTQTPPPIAHPPKPNEFKSL